MTVTQRWAPSVHDFMNDPIGFFGQSYTRMHSIGREELEDLQRHNARLPANRALPVPRPGSLARAIARRIAQPPSKWNMTTALRRRK